ncbi:sulfotransferase family protein [Kitasatospora sp. NPDC056783]|uniref:sulfotransferase family protein n=1 Tax=Kitasatospora sp. NPDC056783 TaxID=3345943 RepID=UPI0036BB27AF
MNDRYDGQAQVCGVGDERLKQVFRPDSPFALHDILAVARQQESDAIAPDPRFVPAFRELAESLVEEAALTPVGVTVARRRLALSLANQLRVRRLVESGRVDPELYGDDAVFVVGLPGTGLRRLQRLLSQHPGLNIPSLWEVARPSTEWAPWRRDPSLVDPFECALWERPGGAAGRRPDPGAPCGDHLLLSYAFHAPSAPVEYRVPRYADWLDSQDATAAYTFHRRALAVILERVHGGRPVLVSEFHALRLDGLLSVYPNARVIRVHRDPMASLAGIAELSTQRRRAWSLRVDPRAVKAEWARRLGRALAGPQWYDASVGSRVLDIAYAELAEMPLLTVRRICEFMDAPLPSSVEQRMLAEGVRFEEDFPGDFSRDYFGTADARLPDIFRDHREIYCRHWGVGMAIQ